MTANIGRREFVAALGVVTVAWPLATHAQQRERMRHIGVLLNSPVDEPRSLLRVTAFVQGLEALGWTVGRNLRIDYRWDASDADRTGKGVAELVALTPDVILVNTG